MLSVRYVDFEENALEDYISKLENDVYAHQSLTEDGIEAYMDSPLLEDETKIYLDFIYQDEDLSKDDDYGLAEVKVNVASKFIDSVPRDRRVKWNKIKEKIRKIFCELRKVLDGVDNVRELIDKTLESLKKNILGGVPAIVSAIIVGLATFFINKLLKRICPE